MERDSQRDRERYRKTEHRQIESESRASTYSGISMLRILQSSILGRENDLEKFIA